MPGPSCIALRGHQVHAIIDCMCKCAIYTCDRGYTFLGSSNSYIIHSRHLIQGTLNTMLKVRMHVVSFIPSSNEATCRSTNLLRHSIAHFWSQNLKGYDILQLIYTHLFKNVVYSKAYIGIMYSRSQKVSILCNSY